MNRGNVEKYSNLYAYQLGLAGSFDNKFKIINSSEIVYHGVCIIKDGVKGVISGAMYYR